MNATKTESLLKTTAGLRRALAADRKGISSPWVASVHDALGKVAKAIQEEVATAEKTLANLGTINPDFQHAPVTERHMQKMHDELVQLGEKVHMLRAEIRQDYLPADENRLAQRCEEIACSIEKLRKDDDAFVVNTVNSNPGSGE